MSEKKPDKSYGLEPDEHIEEAEKEQPKPAEAAESSHVRGLDVCPNCGSPLGGVDAVVCLRCGYDLKTLKVIKVKTGETEAAPPDEPEEAEPLSAPGAGGPALPAAIACVSLLAVGLGYLFGARGLFDVPAGETVGFGARVGGLLGLLVRTGGLALAGLGGLSVLSHMLDRGLGDLRLAAVRMVGIFAALSLLTFFNIESATLEWTIEAICQAVLFVGLAAFFFRLSARDAATLMGVTVFAVIILLLLSALVLWSAGLLGAGAG